MLNYEEQFRLPSAHNLSLNWGLVIWSCGTSRSRVRLNLIASSVTAPSPTQPPLREALFLHAATMSISHVDVPDVPVRSLTCAAAAASRLIRSCDAAHWTIGRRCQDSARQRPRQEIKCLNSLAPVTLFRFSLFVANSHTKRFTNIVLDLTYLLTYWMCVICSQPGFRATSSCCTSVL